MLWTYSLFSLDGLWGRQFLGACLLDVGFALFVVGVALAPFRTGPHSLEDADQYGPPVVAQGNRRRSGGTLLGIGIGLICTGIRVMMPDTSSPWAPWLVGAGVTLSFVGVYMWSLGPDRRCEEFGDV